MRESVCVCAGEWEGDAENERKYFSGLLYAVTASAAAAATDGHNDYAMRTLKIILLLCNTTTTRR